MSRAAVAPEFRSSASSRRRHGHGIQSRRQLRPFSLTINSIQQKPFLKLQQYWKKVPPLKTMKAAASASEDGCHPLHNTVVEFTVKEASSDEEYWSSATLRTEDILTPTNDQRSYITKKKRITEWNFDTIKKRSDPGNSEKYSCIIAVKKEESNGKLTTIVGTLDFMIRHLSQGETYPGEALKPITTVVRSGKPRRQTYVYLTSVYVAKSARRQGVATRMLEFAIETAKSQGLEDVYLHVERANKEAWVLYMKFGFQVDVEDDLMPLLRFTT